MKGPRGVVRAAAWAWPLFALVGQSAAQPTAQPPGALVAPADGPAAAAQPMDTAMAEATAQRLWAERRERLRGERRAEFDARQVIVDGATMPFWYTVVGDRPPAGRSLWISLHGGGGAPAKVNDGQWENQKRLYRPEEGVYVAPRAPVDAWNMWHQAPMDALLDRLIEDFVLFEDVNPDRVYIMGYSAGGDGVFQLAPRMADRWAAAAMMAGHPGDAKPDGLRNIGFALHTGAEDGAYDRNKHAAEWIARLAELARTDAGGYRHQAMLHQGKGHWMDREDAMALPWMATFTRALRAERVVWVQDDVTHRRFAWLAVDDPKAGARIVVERAGQTIRILEAPPATRLRIRLDDQMLDLDREVVVELVPTGGADGGPPPAPRELFRGRPSRSEQLLRTTLDERGDPTGMFSAEVVVEVPAGG